MIHKIVPLIAYMSKFFTLKAGDVVLTGTPDGVGPLQSGDELTVTLDRAFFDNSRFVILFAA